MTAINLWNEAIVDLGAQVSTKLHQDRFRIINRAVTNVASVFSGLLSKYYLEEAHPLVNDGRVNLSEFRMMRSGGSAPNLVLMSDALPQKIIRPVPLEVLGDWKQRRKAFQNRNTAVYSLVGDQIYIAFGVGVTETGSVTMWYSRLPNKVNSDDDIVDFPEESIELVVLKTKRIVAERLGMQVPHLVEEAKAQIQDLYEQAGVVVQNRQIEKDTRALL